ncbi:MAG: hypothetical protein ACD_2C00172G0001 [uncultured bacterium (gcode 4)]|uniref:Uncharacterized protein n=1 Tax=uncultured bacterium (gcode 4) TaxID=1234023 RepID=K2G2M4_9BACT|nr:MAG: hypothetical protein ACD_2C00172G0001 [uncultured bacterium (gcode 4)]
MYFTEFWFPLKEYTGFFGLNHAANLASLPDFVNTRIASTSSSSAINTELLIKSFFSISLGVSQMFSKSWCL